MSVGLLIITHDTIGNALLHTATSVLEDCPLPTQTMAVKSSNDPDQLQAEAQRLAVELDSGDGVLVLTDMYGSTPSNIAYNLHKAGQIHVVAGINLPMLVRILNYPSLDLPSLTKKAISGGSQGIISNDANIL